MGTFRTPNVCSIIKDLPFPGQSCMRAKIDNLCPKTCITVAFLYAILCEITCMTWKLKVV